MLSSHFPHIKIYIRRVQHCHLNGRVQHNAAAQLTPPPPHTAYEQLATMVSKMPRNNLITHKISHHHPIAHQIPPYLNTSLRALLQQTVFKTQQISHKHKLLRLCGRWKGCNGACFKTIPRQQHIIPNHSKFRTFMSPNLCHSLSLNSQIPILLTLTLRGVSVLHKK